MNNTIHKNPIPIIKAIAIMVFTVMILCFSLAGTISDSNMVFYPHKNKAWKRGEMLKYRVHYGWVDAGEASLSVENDDRIIGDRKTYHISGTGKSNRLCDMFFIVRDRFDSYIDEEHLVPLIFNRHTNEGGFLIDQDQYFYHSDSIVNSNGKILRIQPGVQDMLSAFYFARCTDLAGMREGDTFTVNTYVDDEHFQLTVIFRGRETITIDAGTFRCLKFNPVIQQGRVFDTEKDLSVWISDDANKIPIRVEAKLFVGAARMDLKSYDGLNNSPAIVSR